MLAVGVLQHCIAGTRVVVPAPVRLQVHRAQFPLAKRVVDAGGKPPVLFFHADLEPELDQDDATIDDFPLNSRAQLQKTLAYLFVHETHDTFDAGAVVPAAVEDHDFAGGGEVLDETLNVQLRLLTLRWRRQRDDAKGACAYTFCYGLDGAALAGRISAFKHEDDLQPFGFHPFLQMAKLDLELPKLLVVELPLHLAVGILVALALGHETCLGLASIVAIGTD